MPTQNRLRLAMVALLMLLASHAGAFDEFDFGPIHYREATPDNCVSRLQSQLDRGEATLSHDANYGYLPAVLKSLQAPVESQALVFSKTSFQLDFISPRTPRALYFNDEAYVGYCQTAPVLEILAVDPKLGPVFYTLRQQEVGKPRFKRRVDICLACHSSFGAERYPELLARSVFVDADGKPLPMIETVAVNHATPLDQRWGGWYVTGKHGSQSHRGNLIARGKVVANPLENVGRYNLTRLNDRLAVDKYLSPYSDIVALMTLEHQTFVHNRVTVASFAARKVFDGSFEGGAGNDGGADVRSAGEDLVDALLMVNEASFAAPIGGASGFAEQFARRGPRDRQGRSLRDFDLNRRLFKFPCSYLIYSRAFDELPGVIRDYVWRRLGQILSGADSSARFSHLSAEDRRAIAEILSDTMPAQTAVWSKTPSASVATPPKSN